LIRFNALREAIGTSAVGATPEDMLARAEEYYNFITGKIEE